MTLTRRAVLQGAAIGGAGLALGPLLVGCRGKGKPAAAPTVEPTLGRTFPARFGWGAATSAYQIEGAAKEDGRGPSVWDTFSHEPGRVHGGDTGDVAADHYHRYVQDLDIMKGLGLTTYRFSVSWSRVLPTGRGTVNAKGLDFYKRLVDGLHQRGITPVLTLFHWDLPQALQDRGGWENRDCASWFADYARVLYRELGDAVPTWLTINEPKTVVNVGYRYGTHAPGKTDPAAAAVAAHHLMLAHGLAVQALHADLPKARVGPALNLAPAYPADASDDARKATTLADGMENRFWLDAVFKGRYPADVLAALPNRTDLTRVVRPGDLKTISSPIDLLAVNYYNPVYVAADGSYVNKHPTAIASWEQIYPQGLYDILTRVRHDYGDIPMSITENGVPESDTLRGDSVADPDRITYLRDHLAAAHHAIEDGVKLESYHVWSLLDNFEWAEGYGQRWGIVYVDYPTQRRILKDSAKWYQRVIARNGV